jgi:hypothetical protein
MKPSKTVSDVLALIDAGVGPRDALDQCGYGEVSEATMEKLVAREREARSRALQALYAAATDRRAPPASKAKAFEQWEKAKARGEKTSQNITIIIGQESEKV